MSATELQSFESFFDVISFLNKSCWAPTVAARFARNLWKGARLVPRNVQVWALPRVGGNSNILELIRYCVFHSFRPVLGWKKALFPNVFAGEMLQFFRKCGGLFDANRRRDKRNTTPWYMIRTWYSDMYYLDVWLQRGHVWAIDKKYMYYSGWISGYIYRLRKQQSGSRI